MLQLANAADLFDQLVEAARLDNKAAVSAISQQLQAAGLDSLVATALAVADAQGATPKVPTHTHLQLVD